MALAEYFDKVSLSASQRIKGYDRFSFEQKLLSTCVGIVYGSNSVETSEGWAALDLAVRILSRLYPNIKFVDLAANNAGSSFTAVLKSLAVKINPAINCSDAQNPTINLVIGNVPDFGAGQPSIFVGSHNWNALVSFKQAQSCHDTYNPFGAGSAVCFAAAYVFQHVFQAELDIIPPHTDFCLSVYSQRLGQENDPGPSIPSSLPLDFTLVGTGAIGNAVVWGLLGLQELKGRITLIDDQTVSLSNLQRYILMDRGHETHSKVNILKDLFTKFPDVTVEPLQEKWQTVAHSLDKEQTQLLVTALDTPKERLEIQSLLPKVILNAWTSPEGIGVSRHLDFTQEVCLSCLYMPRRKGKSDSEKISESLGNVALEPDIREYLANRLPIDDRFVVLVSQNTRVDAQTLLSYLGQRLEIFYSEAICGGRTISSGTGGHPPQDLEVPLAHESALAGILLCAETVIQTLVLRPNPIEALTKIDMMQPVHNEMLEAESKHYSGLCLCQDPIFTQRYTAKWLNN